MIIEKYRITQIAGPEEDPINQWQIQLKLSPTWIERTFMGKTLSQNNTLVGSCNMWHWGDGSLANYFWRIWAFNAIKRHAKKTGGVTYVNSRFN